MKDSIRFFVGLSLMVLASCYGCGAANPEAEVKAAQEAMEQARSFNAEELATSDWNEAVEAWEEGQAAAEQGKPAKTLFLKARSRFEKTAEIAKSHHDRISGEISNMQQAISEGVERIQTDLDNRKLTSGVRKEVTPVLAEVEAGAESIDELLARGSLLEARSTAREVQKKIYNAQLIMEGKKPAF